MSYSVTGMIGADLTLGVNNKDIRTPAQVTAGLQPYKDGTSTMGADGRKYIYGKTAGNIANNARCDFVYSTKLITAAANGGLINLNGAQIDTGGSGWFAATQNYTAATGITTAAPPG
jgi:hypothetical protein